MRSLSIARAGALAACVALMSLPLAAQDRDADARLVEIRSYNLKPGTRDHFHDLFVRVSLPMLQRAGVDVVAYGPSMHDADSYFLMRAYRSLDDRQRSEDAFYGSDEWKKGPREAVLADIESYTTIVIRVDRAALDGLRAVSAGASQPKGNMR